MTLRGAAVAILSMLPFVAFAQQRTPTHFDVISVKPHDPADTSRNWKWSSTGFEVSNMRLLYLVTTVYQVQPFLVTGLPSWETSTRWDIVAKVVDPDLKPMDKLSFDEQKALMASVLRDRFGMVAHREDKVQPVFLMTVLPDGLKIKKTPPPAEPEAKFSGGTWRAYPGLLTGDITMEDLASVLSNEVERKIIDRTGLTGKYTVALKWMPERRTPGGDDGSAADAPPVMEAVRQQLGLKLTTDRAPVPTVVVESLVKPEEN